MLPQISQRAVAPTILTGVTPQMKIYAEETFGPVVSLYRVESDEEALRLVNNTRYGLNSAVWTGDLRAGEALAARINAGSVNVNDGYAAAWGSIAAPSGGMKDSGVGHRHGPEGILKYCDVRTVAVQKLMHLAAPKWLGEKTWARLLSGYVQLRRGMRR
ncbi:aldehyde dehydrogenase family protein [Arcanobacterium hippocoleae]